ncbi:DUF1361 domain-containing protein [Alteromonas sp. a30]|uniref:DUF1361 domain-containing protein n=1 Tax=Alteromonas sp. a30 TaxID=2730917 RepID=UPI00227EDB37|nr:DUF1361 domain-containing protein [Alteromonas sp. a30]MCY7295643.1 DUF1361 domain-containing protein [Alteromonas sp. a30]
MIIPAHFTVAKNILLAEIPVFLALYLFVFAQKRSIIWWLMCVTFVGFLPNAAYTLTDIIHFIGAIQSEAHSWVYLTFFLFPIYLLFIFINFQFYVVSIMLAQHYIQQEANNRLAKWFIPIIHFACAVGVYLGRIQRLESRAIMEKPITVLRDVAADFTHFPSVLLILFFFILFYGLYLLFAILNRYLWHRYCSPYWQAIEAVKLKKSASP